MIAIGGSKAHATDQQQAKIEFSENTDTLALTRLQMLNRLVESSIRGRSAKERAESSQAG